MCGSNSYRTVVPATVAPVVEPETPFKKGVAVTVLAVVEEDGVDVDGEVYLSATDTISSFHVGASQIRIVDAGGGDPDAREDSAELETDEDEDEELDQFGVGQLVRLRSGGPLMTISHIETESGDDTGLIEEVTCQWSPDDNYIESSQFAPQMLKSAEG